MNLFTELLPRLPVFVLIVLSSVGVVMGDYFAKYWSESRKTTFLILAFVGYLASSFFYIPSLLKEGLVVTSVIWSLLSILGFLFVGIVLFHETLNTLQIIGVAVGCVALVILAVASHSTCDHHLKDGGLGGETLKCRSTRLPQYHHG